MQITLFLPALVLYARRAEKNKLDCFCCVTSKHQHDYESPQGCCCCCFKRVKEGRIKLMLASLADWVATSAGRLFVAASFAALLAMGIYGAIELTTDFKLEWFLPVDSYVRDFETLNQDYFTDGTRFSIYTTERTTYTDSTMSSIDAYLAGSSCVDGSSIDSWYTAFARSNSSLSATNVDTWLKQPQNKRFMGSVRFIDNDPGKGFMSTRIGAMMLLNCTESGTVRWNTLSDMRKGMEAIDSTVFPYSYLFAYWEEVGVIEKGFSKFGHLRRRYPRIDFRHDPKPSRGCNCHRSDRS